MVFCKMCSRRPSLFLIVVAYVCLSCGLAFARRRMLLDTPVCMIEWFTSVTCQRCLWRRVLVRLAPPIVVPFPRIR